MGRNSFAKNGTFFAGNPGLLAVFGCLKLVTQSGSINRRRDLSPGLSDGRMQIKLAHTLAITLAYIIT